MTQPPPPYGPPDEPPSQPPVPPPYGAAYGPPTPAPQPYGAYGAAPYGTYTPDHPQATLALVLGIVGLVVCGVVAPFAWVIGGRAVREIDASQGRLGGRSSANTGRILGIVGSVILGLGVLFFALFVLAVIAGSMTTPG